MAKPRVFIFLLCLAAVALFRASLLEYNDLLDPTEARYAAIAQEMSVSGNWVTPELPSEGGEQPYLGKPPLHFWLTALSYNVFGVEEWTSRLPSFLAAAGTLLVLFIFALRFFSLQTALLSVLITCTSTEFFFFSGCSTIDMTLTLFMTLCASALAFFAAEGKTRYLLLASAAAALGFLTKGPIAPVFAGGVFFIWLAFTKRLSLLKLRPLAAAGGVFAAIVLPWLLLCEVENPGFLRYFIVTENIGRFLFKDFGDRYGSGHIHPYGTAIWMSAVAFLPWSLVIVPAVFCRGWTKRAYAECRARPVLTYVLLWAFVPVCFFSFARQLHFGYVLPSIPPFAVLLGYMFTGNRVPGLALTKHIASLFSLLVVSTPAVALWLGVPLRPFPAAVLSAALIAGYLSMRSLQRDASSRRYVISMAGASFAFYVCSMIVLSPLIDRWNSTEGILKQMVDQIAEYNPVIGVITNNTYSHYWLTRNGISELGRPARIVAVDVKRAETLPDHMLIEIKHIKRLPAAVRERFVTRLEYGKWAWLERSSRSLAATARDGLKHSPPPLS